jgi:hypothetical protein
MCVGWVVETRGGGGGGGPRGGGGPKVFFKENFSFFWKIET